MARRRIQPPPRVTRAAVYVKTGWQGYSRSHLAKSSKDRYGITDPASTPTSTLRKAYLHTQYNKLRRAGVGRHEARRLSVIATPTEISRTAKDRRLYVDEMVLRHRAPMNAKAWAKERKSMRLYMGRKSYSASQWEKFSTFYGKYPKGRFETAGVRKEKREQERKDFIEAAKYMVDTIKAMGGRKSRGKARVERWYQRALKKIDEKETRRSRKVRKTISEGERKPHKPYRDKKGRFAKRK